MKDKKLSEKMKQEAVLLGLCAQWTAEWKEETTKDDMAEKFIRGLDFCIKHDWPKVDVMKQCFGDVMHDHGIYADETLHMADPDTMVLNGRCDASVTCGNYASSDIYARHKTKLRLKVRDNAYVHVSVYDEAQVEIECTGNAKCFVYRYGGNVEATGKVVVRERAGAPGT